MVPLVDRIELVRVACAENEHVWVEDAPSQLTAPVGPSDGDALLVNLVPNGKFKTVHESIASSLNFSVHYIQ